MGDKNVRVMGFFPMHFRERAVTKTLGASVYLRRVCENIFTWLHQVARGVRMHGRDFGISTCRKKPASHCSAQCTLRRQVYAEKYCSSRRRCARPLGAIRILAAAEPMHPAGEDTPERGRVHVAAASQPKMH